MEMTTISSRLRALGFAALALAPPAGFAAGVLENPQPGATASGIGLISGWHCTASRIEVVIDGAAPLVAARGTTRTDTGAACGRTDTGFGYLVNWAALAPGLHAIRALADGIEFARAEFRVASFGIEFLTGKSGSVTLDDFPAPGLGVDLKWMESLQSFGVDRVFAGTPTLGGRWNGANLERRSACTQAQNEGSRGTYAQYDIVTTSESLNVTQTGITGLTCEYRGTLATPGMLRTATGTYTCSDGKRGTWKLRDYLARATEMQLRLDVKLDTTETCTVDSILGGSRF